MNYLSLYERRKADKILELFSDDTHLCGTGKDEEAKTKSDIKNMLMRDWSQSRSGKIEITQKVEQIIGETAVVMLYGQAHIGIADKVLKQHIRITSVLRKFEGVWKICHQHWSFPEPTQEEGQSFPKM